MAKHKKHVGNDIKQIRAAVNELVDAQNVNDELLLALEQRVAKLEPPESPDPVDPPDPADPAELPPRPS